MHTLAVGKITQPTTRGYLGRQPTTKHRHRTAIRHFGTAVNGEATILNVSRQKVLDYNSTILQMKLKSPLLSLTGKTRSGFLRPWPIMKTSKKQPWYTHNNSLPQ